MERIRRVGNSAILCELAKKGVKEGKGSERREAAVQGQKTGVFLDE